MVEPGIEPGTSWLVVRDRDHEAGRVNQTHVRRFKPAICAKLNWLSGCAERDAVLTFSLIT